MGQSFLALVYQATALSRSSTLFVPSVFPGVEIVSLAKFSNGAISCSALSNFALATNKAFVCVCDIALVLCGINIDKRNLVGELLRNETFHFHRDLPSSQLLGDYRNKLYFVTLQLLGDYFKRSTFAPSSPPSSPGRSRTATDCSEVGLHDADTDRCRVEDQ